MTVSVNLLQKGLTPGGGDQYLNSPLLLGKRTCIVTPNDVACFNKRVNVSSLCRPLNEGRFSSGSFDNAIECKSVMEFSRNISASVIYGVDVG